MHPFLKIKQNWSNRKRNKDRSISPPFPHLDQIRRKYSVQMQENADQKAPNTGTFYAVSISKKSDSNINNNKFRTNVIQNRTILFFI